MVVFTGFSGMFKKIKIMKKSMTMKSREPWVFVAATIITLIIAVVAGLHYFGRL
jgi:hypothetical protein